MYVAVGICSTRVRNRRSAFSSASWASLLSASAAAMPSAVTTATPRKTWRARICLVASPAIETRGPRPCTVRPAAIPQRTSEPSAVAAGPDRQAIHSRNGTATAGGMPPSVSATPAVKMRMALATSAAKGRTKRATWARVGGEPISRATAHTAGATARIPIASADHHSSHVCQKGSSRLSAMLPAPIVAVIAFAAPAPATASATTSRIRSSENPGPAKKAIRVAASRPSEMSATAIPRLERPLSATRFARRSAAKAAAAKAGHLRRGLISNTPR